MLFIYIHWCNNLSSNIEKIEGDCGFNNHSPYRFFLGVARRYRYRWICLRRERQHRSSRPRVPWSVSFGIAIKWGCIGTGSQSWPYWAVLCVGSPPRILLFDSWRPSYRRSSICGIANKPRWRWIPTRVVSLFWATSCWFLGWSLCSKTSINYISTQKSISQRRSRATAAPYYQHVFMLVLAVG